MKRQNCRHYMFWCTLDSQVDVDHSRITMYLLLFLQKRRGCSAVLVPKAYLITENSFLNFMDNKMRVDNGFTTSHILIYSQLTIPTWIVQAGKL